jgi:isopentenyl phosphate kinase
MGKWHLCTNLVIITILWSTTHCEFVGVPTEVTLIKAGGSSITEKATKEKLNVEALNWMATTLTQEISSYFKVPESALTGEPDECNANAKAFVIVHGAGSFGHHNAKEFGLKGRTEPPATAAEKASAAALSTEEETKRRRIMQGVARTRLSVQRLNNIVVSSLVEHGINAVGISPCFGIPRMQAHGGDDDAASALREVVYESLRAGLVPVLHGDACLYGEQGGGIISGDTLMQILAQAPWVSRAIFLTDVDGVFTKDPRSDPHAQLLKTIEIDTETAELTSVVLEASGSTHDHDVTGGLKVRTKRPFGLSILHPPGQNAQQF